MHKFDNRANGQTLKVRLGEWDASSSTEPIQAQEFSVAKIFIHPQFNAANCKNDIAVLRLASQVPLGVTPTIGTVCLPSNQILNQRCWVAGNFFLFRVIFWVFFSSLLALSLIRIRPQRIYWRLSKYIERGRCASCRWQPLSNPTASHEIRTEFSSRLDKLHVCGW